MGRPKKGQEPKRETVPDARVAIIHLKGTPAYAEWLDDAHRKTLIPKAMIFRDALIDWAKKKGLPSPPEM
jgi:hypothetical protein